MVLECTAVDNVYEMFLDTHVNEIYLLLKIDYNTKEIFIKTGKGLLGGSVS